MSLLLYGDAAKRQLICAKGALSRSCSVPAQAGFSVDVKTGPAPARGFQGYQIVLQYSGSLTLEQQAGLAENRWAACGSNGFESKTAPTASQPGRYTIGCKAGPPPRTYKGVLANIHFICKGSGTGQIDIVGGAGAQVSFYDRPSIYGNRIFLASDPKNGKNVADAVTVRCGLVTEAGATDTDGDGCTDAQEQGNDERHGGRRDATNPWDFFDPTGDRRHRLDDILQVIQHYGQNSGAAGYSERFDRSYLGPNYWNLGPPDGKITSEDVHAIESLYFQDCA
jgi:hypothetical protein